MSNCGKDESLRQRSRLVERVAGGAGLDLARADEPGQYGEHLRRLVRRGADVLAGDLFENPLRSRLVEHRVSERGGVQHDHPPNSSRTEHRSEAVSMAPS